MDYVNKLVRDGLLDTLKQEGKMVTFEILSDEQEPLPCTCVSWCF
jgi:hypothetical protein